ncbi:MAG TPA: hypothetical protein VG165_12445 [Solirubrobacteraceae bacterium]|jgi:hypothetical protein|nr:hypothetical protein [Solirubrobacteraceae bacterium]
MNKASLPAVALLAIASTGIVGVAAAQSPVTTPPAVTAQAAVTAAATAAVAAGKSGLVSSAQLAFSFTAAGLTCPSGTTNPRYCVDNVSGGFRFILRVEDDRPGLTSTGSYPVIATFLTTGTAGAVFNSLTCLPIDATATGCPLTIRPKGLTILSYAEAHGKKLPTLLIAHVRPKGSATSTEVLQFLNL